MSARFTVRVVMRRAPHATGSATEVRGPEISTSVLLVRPLTERVAVEVPDREPGAFRARQHESIAE
jgi:hypothetical protein